MLSQLKASQLSVEIVKSQAAEKRKEELAEERVKFEREKRILEEELVRRRKEEIGKVKKDFESQLSALKLQVRKADELRSKEVNKVCCFTVFKYRIRFNERLLYYHERINVFSFN